MGSISKYPKAVEASIRALRAPAVRPPARRSPPSGDWNELASGKYDEPLRGVLRRFVGTTVVDADELRSSPTAVLDRVLRAVGLGPSHTRRVDGTYERSNQNVGVPRPESPRRGDARPS